MTLPITLNCDSEFMDFDTVESQVTQYQSVDWTSTGLDEPLCDVTNSADSDKIWLSVKTNGNKENCKSDCRMKEKNNNCVLTKSKSWHTCGSSCIVPKRPSMLWNTKYRLKEERKKILKISVTKLRQIEDPESFLRRSVLINNTTKRLQQEVREEKQGKYTGWYYSNHYARIRESFSFTRCDPDEVMRMQFTSLWDDSPRLDSSKAQERVDSDDLNDISDTQDLLSQLYIPTIPNSVNDEKPIKRLKTEKPAPECNEIVPRCATVSTVDTVCSKDNVTDAKSNGDLKSFKDTDSWLSGLRKDLFFPKDTDKPYSCGQSSLCELQSVVFHSLITSLES